MRNIMCDRFAVCNNTDNNFLFLCDRELQCILLVDKPVIITFYKHVNLALFSNKNIIVIDFYLTSHVLTIYGHKDY